MDNPDPQLAIARKYLGVERRYAEVMLKEIDAIDPLRQPPGDEAVEAALQVIYGEHRHHWQRDVVEGMRKTLTAALAVMARGTVQLAPGHTDLMVSPESIDAFIEANPPPDPPTTGWRRPEAWSSEKMSAPIEVFFSDGKIARQTQTDRLHADAVAWREMAAPPAWWWTSKAEPEAAKAPAEKPEWTAEQRLMLAVEQGLNAAGIKLDDLIDLIEARQNGRY